VIRAAVRGHVVQVNELFPKEHHDLERVEQHERRPGVPTDERRESPCGAHSAVG
jgi:hypothetical protein